MAVRAETYALVRPVPYLLQRGVTQTVSAPIRHGATGALVTVTESGSTVTIMRPDGTALASAAAVSVTSSGPTYTVAPSASEALGDGYTFIWSLIIDGETFLFRESAYVCEYVPNNVISVLDLYSEYPELKHNIPADQGTRGDNVGWQPQVDGAYYDFIRKLLDDGRPAWKLREKSTGVREWILTRALQRCIQGIPKRDGSTWERVGLELYHRARNAEASLKLQYDDDDAGVRRGGSAVIRLVPTGRPVW